MCDNEGIFHVMWETLYDLYTPIKRWYTGITSNCDCKDWVKKDHCHYYYIIYPSVTEMPRCLGWKVCPRASERYKLKDYNGKPATTRFKEKFLAFANTDRGAWIVAGGCLGGIMLLDGLLMWLITGTFKFFM